MEFSESSRRATVKAVRAGLADLTSRIDAVDAAVRTAIVIPPLPAPIAAATLAAGEQLVDIAVSIRDAISDLLVGAAAPAVLFATGLDWFDVERSATGVQGMLRVDQLSVGEHWKGYAADRYTTAVRTQSDAAGRIGLIADRAAGVLIFCAAAGLTFYVAIGLILSKVIAALAAAIVSLGSGVFSLAGLALALEEVSVSGITVAAVVTALAGLIAAQVSQLGALHSALADTSVFRAGHWPGAATPAYRDATVTDGDAAWSFER